MSGNSWEVDSYKQGKWQVSVRNNPENDRVDEGDYPEGSLYIQKVPTKLGEPIKLHVFKDNLLVAEVRGTDGVDREIIPMSELDSADEENLYRLLDHEDLGGNT